MDIKEKLLLFSAQEANILPLTSACNVSCIFCSHAQNPRGVKTYGIGHRSIADIKESLDYFDPTQKIVIGESVTRIMEGEPFLHPQIREILQAIRERFPKTTIQLTTNGSLLTDEMLHFLSQLGEIQLYISLNSVTPSGRQRLMGDDGEEVRRAIPRLKELNIAFQGSIVAMPWIVGWDDLEATVKYLAANQAETIRIFLPGFTRLASQELSFSAELPLQLYRWVQRMRLEVFVPISLEPPFLTDLKAEVVGIIQGSPASKAGLCPGDIIKEVDGQPPFSRVDAFYRIQRDCRPEIRFERPNSGEVERLKGKEGEQRGRGSRAQDKIIELEKEPGQSSGLVFDYDVSPELFQEIEDCILDCQAKRVLLMSSTLAGPILKEVTLRLNQKLTSTHIDVTVVPNRFFGGSIGAAGLLVVQDFLAHWESLPIQNYDLIIVPGRAFDPWGNDLMGENIRQLQESVGIYLEGI